MIWGYLAALAGMLLYAAASLAQGHAARRASGAAVLRHPAYVAGLVCDGLAWVCSLVALAHLPLFAVQALLAGSLAVTVLLAIPVLKLRPSRPELIAVVVTTLGLVLVSAAAGPESDVAAPRWVTWGLWTLVAAAAIGGAWFYRRGGAVVLGLFAGLAYSVAALGARVARLGERPWLPTLLDPAVWAIAAGGVLGVVLYARSLERGVGAATAALWVVEVVAPGLIGIALLGDPIRPGWLLPAIIGIGLCVAGCAVLARSPAQG